MKRIVLVVLAIALITSGGGPLAADQEAEHPCARGYSNMLYD